MDENRTSHVVIWLNPNTNFALRVATENNSNCNQKLSQANKKLHHEVADLSEKCHKIKSQINKTT